MKMKTFYSGHIVKWSTYENKRLIVGFFTSSYEYLMQIQNENKLNNTKMYINHTAIGKIWRVSGFCSGYIV